jgi:hypothetical protein
MIYWAFDCWSGRQMTGPGRLTVMIGRAGEPSQQPVRADDIVQPRPGTQ